MVVSMVVLFDDERVAMYVVGEAVGSDEGLTGLDTGACNVDGRDGSWLKVGRRVLGWDMGCCIVCFDGIEVGCDGGCEDA